ncbi:thioredoxin domain-containing protein [Sphingomonas sp. Leaf4]|uniref:thioredoxin domain-containing protein n=1 Tax=Sphingomonas sp. Leaf4 TaxID=2876553 RepID=UPI001E4B96C4|nr:thioredoxin domain-containing protein [Sphingomonas sp. Leaf4]
MRILLLVFSFLLALVGLPHGTAHAAPRPAAARDWTTSIVFTPDGRVQVGNPAAKVTLTEWLSYTCSHCADFAAESKVELHALIRSGKVRVDYRTMPRDALDLAAGLLVRCAGPAKFLRLHDAVFAGQKAMLDRAQAFAATPPAQQPAATIGARLVQLADATPLRAIGRAAGVTDAAYTACLNDDAAQKRVIAVAEAAQTANIASTPSFEVNGRRVEAHGWAALKPQLVATR